MNVTEIMKDGDWLDSYWTNLVKMYSARGSSYADFKSVEVYKIGTSVYVLNYGGSNFDCLKSIEVNTSNEKIIYHR